ncbi:hypothetical protein [Streptomyces noursei]|uniref:hypothetical protein n=1 Tax=Streptomyces noursei TaxID=1971 RepID=UPI001679F634|nr:hypothetical protein [Streptomyces noursei]MCZ1020836.1 hypothetical protein [Streptomyces noursei]
MTHRTGPKATGLGPRGCLVLRRAADGDAKVRALRVEVVEVVEVGAVVAFGEVGEVGEVGDRASAFALGELRKFCWPSRVMWR